MSTFERRSLRCTQHTSASSNTIFMPQSQRSMTESLHPYSASTSPFPSPGSFVTNPHSPSFFPSPTAQEAGSPFADDQGQGCPRIMPPVEYSSLAIPRTATPETSSMEQGSHYTPSVGSADGAGTPFSSADQSQSNAPSPFQPNLDGLGIHMPDSSGEDHEESFQATIRPQRARPRPHSFHGDSNVSLDGQSGAYDTQGETVSAGPTPSISMPGRMSDVLGYPSNTSMASGMSSFRSVSDGNGREVKVEMPQSVAIRSATSDWRSRKARLSHQTQPYPLLSHAGEQSNMRLKLHPIDQTQPGWIMNAPSMALAYQPYPVGYGANGETVYATQMGTDRGDMQDQSAVRTNWVQPGAPPHFHGQAGQTYNGPISAYSPINSPYHLATPNPSMYYSCDPTALHGQGQPTSAPSSYAQPGAFQTAIRMRPPPNAHLYSPVLNYAPSPMQSGEMNRPPGEPIMIKQEMDMTPLRSSESDLSGPEGEESGSEYHPSPKYRPMTLKALRQVSNSSLQSSGSSSYRPKNRHSRVDPPIEALIQKRPRGRSVAIDPSQVNAKKTYMCDIGACNMQPLYFGRREHLKRHMMGVHTNQKPYVCSHPECGKAFSRSDNRNHHEKKVHSIYQR